MPLVCEFFGIKIYMYWDDHTPPHFHAQYGNNTALVSIHYSCYQRLSTIKTIETSFGLV